MQVHCNALLLVAATCGYLPTLLAGQADSDWATRRAADHAIVQAFQTESGGYSVDEVIIDDSRRARWLDAVASDWQTKGDDWQTQTLLRLLSLRKAGKLPAQSSKRGAAVQADLIPIAEIAARSVLDHHQVSSDVLICDPRLRAELQEAASNIVATAEPYAIRKAVLRLRKTRKLRPELVLRVTDWDRTIEIYSRKQIEASLQVSSQPEHSGQAHDENRALDENRAHDEDRATISRNAGVYLFRDSTGYLYIGEAVDLHQRLTQHLHESDRLSLRRYLDSVADGSVTVELHVFGKNSPANELTIRRAYESELIRSREPRFNLRP
jgi:hypothetical protein